MGCCFSIPKQGQNGLKNQLRSHEAECRIPLPPHVEEESVKEVLSETPISKPQQEVPILMPQTKTQLPVIQNPKKPINKALELEQASLVSETCSNSESFSTVTTVTENKDEATSKPKNREETRNPKRSYTVDGNRIGGRERRHNSPAKKIPAGSRTVHRGESNQTRRESGEGSCRRSRSPSSARTVGTGAGRSQLRPPGGVCRRIPPVKGVVEQKDSVTEESLENPHVSLECFIFL